VRIFPARIYLYDGKLVRTLETGEFGQLTYTEEDVLVFPVGLAGFEEYTHFLRRQPPALAPFEVLLSLDWAGLRFYALPVDLVVSDYQLSLGPQERALLVLGAEDRPSHCLVLLAWPENEPPTVNLLAPVVLNQTARRGLQVIQFDSQYSCRHPLRERSASCS